MNTCVKEKKKEKQAWKWFSESSWRESIRHESGEARHDGESLTRTGEARHSGYNLIRRGA